MKSNHALRIFVPVLLLLAFTTAHPVTDNNIRDVDNRRNPQHQRKKQHKQRVYVCPSDFIRVGNACYYLSAKPATWQDAHWQCRDKRAELASPAKSYEDRHLRAYLNTPKLKIDRAERWIGGTYNWLKREWAWGVSGAPFGYHGFSRRDPRTTPEQLKWHCVVMDPDLNYKWSSRSCVQLKHYICQANLRKIPRHDLRKHPNPEKLNLINVPKQFDENLGVYQRTRPKKNKPRKNNVINSNDVSIPNGYNNNNRIDIPFESNTIEGALLKPENYATAYYNNGYQQRNSTRNELIRRRRKHIMKERRDKCLNQRIFNRQNNIMAEESPECQRILNKRSKKRRRNRAGLAIENITSKTFVMDSSHINSLIPKPIVEIHDF